MDNEQNTLNLDEWYNPQQAAARLQANSNKEIAVSYVRTLARYGKIRSIKMGERMSLYNKADVDAYIVEERGEKSARAKRQRAMPKKAKKQAA